MNDQIKVNGVSYHQRTNVCGNPDCKCMRGQKHGPYWYASSDNGSATYVGKNLPEHVLKHIELLKASGPKLKAIKAKITKRRDEHYEAYCQAERELNAVRNLEAGEYTASAVLTSLGLAQFNGHEK